MPGNSFSSAPGSRGGLGTGFADGGEQFDENMLQAAAQQAGSQPATLPSSTSGAAPQPTLPDSSQGPVRAVTPEKELEWFVSDVGKGLVQLLDLNILLTGSKPGDTPEQQAKKRQMHQRYQSFAAEEKAVIDQKYQQAQAVRQQQQEKEQAEAQRRQQAQRQQMVMPSSVKKGAVGPGGKSGKSQAAQQLEQQRKQMPGPSKVN